MSSPLNLLEQLLPKLEAYSKEETQISLEGFVDYVKEKTKEAQPLNAIDSTAIATMKSHDNTNAQIAFHVNRLNKYAKYYIKDAFKELTLSKADDFGFLASIIQFGSISKTKLIAYNVSEVPAGMDVIKRLVKSGLVVEKVDKNDRRIKLLEVTEKGRAAFFAAMQQMEKVGGIVGGKLSDTEKKALLALLEKLDHFHERIYQENKEYNLEYILEAYM